MSIYPFILKRMRCYVLVTGFISSPLGASASIDPFSIDQATTRGPGIPWSSPLHSSVKTQAKPQDLLTLPNKALSLVEITDFALEHNPATYQAWAQAKLAAANLGIAKTAYLPQISAGGAVEYSANIFSNPNNNTGNSGFAYGPNVSLSYLLLDFGSRAHTVKANRYLLIAANLNQNAMIQQVILQVQQAYYQLLGQQALSVADEKSLKEAQASLDSAQALRQNGLATIGDVYQAQASLAKAKLNVERSQGNYQLAMGQLTTAMGLPVDTPIKLLPLATELSVQKVQQAIKQLLFEAKQHRPDLLAAEVQVRAAQSQLQATKAAALPTVQLAAIATPEGNSLGVSNAAVSLSISVPLFTGYSQTYNERRAKAQIMVAQAGRDQLAHQIEWQVWQAYYTLQTAEKTLATTEILLRNSAQAAQQTQGQYKAGVGNILSVLSTQSDLASARVENIQAKLTWYTALAQLAAAMGVLNAN